MLELSDSQDSEIEIERAQSTTEFTVSSDSRSENTEFRYILQPKDSSSMVSGNQAEKDIRESSLYSPCIALAIILIVIFGFFSALYQFLYQDRGSIDGKQKYEKAQNKKVRKNRMQNGFKKTPKIVYIKTRPKH